MPMDDYKDGLKGAYEQPGAVAVYEAGLPEPAPVPVSQGPIRGLFFDPEKDEYFLTFDSMAEEIRKSNNGLIEVTGDETHELEYEKREAIDEFIALDLAKPQILEYFDEVKQALAKLSKFIPLNGYFKGPDGTVYKLVKPGGQYVHFKDLDCERTKRPGETRGTLSMKEAKDAEANNFQPLPEDQ